MIRQIAHRQVAHGQPCEVIFHDAYRRVIGHELVGVADSDPAAVPQRETDRSAQSQEVRGV